MSDVRLTLLGGFAATVDGVPVPDSAWRLKKARELVKLLALARDHRLHREQVMDVLWRDLAPAAAANNLHQAVHVARRALDPAAIESRDGALYLRLRSTSTSSNRRQRTHAGKRRQRPSSGTRRLRRRAAARESVRRLGRGPSRRLAAIALEFEDEVAGLGSGGRSRSLRTRARSSAASRELSELSSLLGRTRLLTLAGTGGVGKTRLALELARGAEARTSPAPCSSSSALSQTRGSCRRPSQPRSTCAPSRRRTRRRRDRLSRAAVAPARARQLRAPDRETRGARGPAAPRVPAASRSSRRAANRCASPGRSSLGSRRSTSPIPSERCRPTASSGTSPSRCSSSAPPPRRRVQLDDEVAEDVARICLRLDGLPLALELAAGRLER